jgi:hypothetical protein
VATAPRRSAPRLVLRRRRASRTAHPRCRGHVTGESRAWLPIGPVAKVRFEPNGFHVVEPTWNPGRFSQTRSDSVLPSLSEVFRVDATTPTASPKPGQGAAKRDHRRLVSHERRRVSATAEPRRSKRPQLHCRGLSVRRSRLLVVRDHRVLRCQRHSHAYPVVGVRATWMFRVRGARSPLRGCCGYRRFLVQ